jgi:hypothetical protein
MKQRPGFDLPKHFFKATPRGECWLDDLIWDQEDDTKTARAKLTVQRPRKAATRGWRCTVPFEPVADDLVDLVAKMGLWVARRGRGWMKSVLGTRCRDGSRSNNASWGRRFGRIEDWLRDRENCGSASRGVRQGRKNGQIASGPNTWYRWISLETTSGQRTRPCHLRRRH